MRKTHRADSGALLEEQAQAAGAQSRQLSCPGSKGATEKHSNIGENATDKYSTGVAQMNSFKALQPFTSKLSRYHRGDTSEERLEQAEMAPVRQACTCGARPRPRAPMERCAAHVSEYCCSTSIHGLRYVGDEHRPIAERLLWVLLFAISLALCSYLIVNVWLKWQRNPVIVSFAEMTTPVWEVPFPAVTICSETKADRAVFNYSDAHERVGNLSDYEWEAYRKLATVCNNIEKGPQDANDNVTDEETVVFLRKVALTMEDTIFQYGWRNKFFDVASSGFRQTMTEDGLCFTFNILDEEDIYTEEVASVMKRNNGNEDLQRRPVSWSAERGFEEGLGLDTHPVRSLGPGRDNGLHVTVRIHSNDIDYICEGAKQGFKVVLHSPAEVPQTGLQYLQVPLDQDVTVAVQPHLLTTSEGLWGYPPQRRMCYFPSERRLRYFRTYTQRNCELECLTNITLQRCSCVRHDMPRTEGTPLCALGSYDCIYKSAEELVMRKVEKNLYSDEGDTSSGHGDCDCLPSCADLRFDVEISQATLDVNNYIKANKLNISQTERYRMSLLSVYFKSSEFLPSRRSELYGVTDFIANCGGLLGLFMGFSLLSLVEVLYFFSARLGFSRMLKRSSRLRAADAS